MSNRISGRRVAFQPRFVHRVLLTVLGMLLAFPLALHAQTYYGTIVGNVTDSSGAAVPGAKVTVRNTGTNSTYTATASGQGSYSVPQLAVGSYEVQVTLGQLQGVRLDRRRGARFDHDGGQCRPCGRLGERKGHGSGQRGAGADGVG